MVRLIVVAVLVVALLVPCVAAAWPVQCWYAAETGKLFDWIACAVVMVAIGEWEEGSDWYGPVRG